MLLDPFGESVCDGDNSGFGEVGVDAEIQFEGVCDPTKNLFVAGFEELHFETGV